MAARTVMRRLLAATLAGATVASLSCSGQSASTNGSSLVRGKTYRLRAVDGAVLPTRFAPLEDAPPFQTVRLDSGRITFKADGRASGAWKGTSEAAVVSRVFEGEYAEDGGRVLIYGNGSAVPDTADVSDGTMTVRAQFFRVPSGERYVVVMSYVQ